MCHLRWHSFGAKPSGPRGAIGTRFWVARFTILGRIGPLHWIVQIFTVDEDKLLFLFLI